MAATDPFRVLGVGPGAGDAEVRASYRRLVQLHHPDHNGGSAESARRFEEVQEAYARIRELRARPAGGPGATSRQGTANGAGTTASSSATSRPGAAPSSGNPDLEARLAAMEFELREARKARAREQEAREQAERAERERREQARRAAEARERAAAEERRRAREAADPDARHATDEELGYVTTDDSFGKILDDAASGLSQRLAKAGETNSVAKRVSDLIDGLDALTSQIDRRRPRTRDD